MNSFDLIIIGVITLSGLFAFARGFVHEVLSVGAWVGAAFAEVYGYPIALPIIERFVPQGVVADIVSGAVVFFTALILLSILSAAIARRVKNSSLSALDRTLGLFFGLVRGAVIACLGYLVVCWAIPEANQPDWIRQGRTIPALSSGANVILSMLPPGLRGKVDDAAGIAHEKLDQAQEAESALRALQLPHVAPPVQAVPPNGSESAAGKGYTTDERRDLNRLIQQNAQ